MNDERVSQRPEALEDVTLAVDRMARESFARLAKLAKTFPTLACRPHGSLEELKRIAADTTNGRHTQEAARFCLMVWDGAIGRSNAAYLFDFRAAWGAWDSTHRSAWQSWATALWFA
jgi:hypothetical protein